MGSYGERISAGKAISASTDEHLRLNRASSAPAQSCLKRDMGRLVDTFSVIISISDKDC